MGVRPDMVGIVVRSIPESLRFYRLLGLEVPEAADGEPYAEVITPNGYRISWNTVAMISELHPEWVEPAGYRMGLAFKCDSVGEVDAVYERLVGAGYAGYKAPWDAFWGQRYAMVADPDGNIVDLFAPLAAEAGQPD